MTSLECSTHTCSRNKCHPCPECGKCFATPFKLNEHQRVHSGEQPFECEMCPMKFSIKRNLVRHQQFHLGVKNYECSVCSKKFSEKHTLTAHFRLHTDEQPFACKICRKTFRHSGNLAVHMRTHTGEKPYECPYCMKKFSVSSSCHRHVKAMHSRTENFSVENENVPSVETGLFSNGVTQDDHATTSNALVGGDQTFAFWIKPEHIEQSQ